MSLNAFREEYQARAIHGIRAEYRAGHKGALLVMPTGAGKTRTGAKMVKAAAEKGTPTLWLADRIELVEQASETFTALGIRHGLIGDTAVEDDLVLLGTIQTFQRRYDAGRFNPPGIRFMVWDEAHRGRSATYEDVRRIYPQAHLLGLTATPFRSDGRGLGGMFGGMVAPVTPRELLDAGVLVPPQYYAPDPLAFIQEDVESPKLIGNVVEHFARVTPDRSAVYFAHNVQHSVSLRDAFNSVGITACHIDGGTERQERKALMSDFRAGHYQVLCNYGVAIEGLDVPHVSCVGLARKTDSLRIFIQAVGRGLRSADGKTDCAVHDHAGLVHKFGPAEEYGQWTLAHDEGQRPYTAPRKRTPKEARESTCEDCAAVMVATRTCPACGHVHTFERGARDVEVGDGELEALTAEGRKKLEHSQEEKKEWWAGLQWFVAGKGWKPGAAYRMYCEKFGVGPGNWQKEVKPQPPSAEVQAWIRHRNIKRAKAREKEAQHAAQAAD